MKGGVTAKRKRIRVDVEDSEIKGRVKGQREGTRGWNVQVLEITIGG